MANATTSKAVLAKNIQRFRESKNLSVIEAARLLGVGRQYWYLIENALANLPIDKMDRIAEILGVTVHDLLGEPRHSTGKESRHRARGAEPKGSNGSSNGGKKLEKRRA